MLGVSSTNVPLRKSLLMFVIHEAEIALSVNFETKEWVTSAGFNLTQTIGCSELKSLVNNYAAVKVNSVFE
jgi:hypothetical protein